MSKSATLTAHADLAADRIRTALSNWPSQSIVDGRLVRDLLLDLLADLRPIITPREDS